MKKGISDEEVTAMLEKARSCEPPIAAYYNLQAGIVEQADEDYFEALFCYNWKMKKELDKWFVSDWGNNLCMGHGKDIMGRIHREVRRIRSHVKCEKKGQFITDIVQTEQRDKVLDGLKITIIDGCYAPRGLAQLRMMYHKLKKANLIDEV